MKSLIANIHFLSAVAFAVLWVWGFFALFNSRYLLGGVHAWLEGKTNYKVMKPIMACPPCMASLHGTIIYVIMFPGFNVLQWIVFVIVLMGANFLIKEFLYPEPVEEFQVQSDIDQNVVIKAEAFTSYTDIDPTIREHQILVKELLDHYKQTR
jgi:hypothetical protein